jgi:hypothetical protein
LYIHFGEEIIIHEKDIIAIIDKKSVELSESMNDLLSHDEHSIQKLGKSFKSIIITTKNIYFSPLTSNTLKKRFDKWLISDNQLDT